MTSDYDLARVLGRLEALEAELSVIRRAYPAGEPRYCPECGPYRGKRCPTCYDEGWDVRSGRTADEEGHPLSGPGLL